MTSRPFDVELSLRQHGASLRQLAAELLRDPEAADDAVQEVWAAALRRPPRHAGSLGGWLATALRNIARKLRRGEQRRVRREAVVAREEEVEDHATVLAREELLHRLVAAVSSLEAPFREAIWQRYFEGMAPRDIAEASGVPVATVKSRLQRGLQQLREQLGEDGESDWRSGLAAAFGWQDSAVPAGAAGTTATTWSGVMLMTAWTKAMTAVAVVAIVAVLLWSLREPDVAVPGASLVAVADATVAASRPEAKPVENAGVAAVAPIVERSEVKLVTGTPRTRNATLRGRCVDASGAPLADCTVRLSGRSADQDRMDAWLSDHPAPPDWTEPPAQTTAADGGFTFTFSPPPPFAFSLGIVRAGCVGMAGDWRRIADEESVDVGDVAMRPGITVVGRVVDEQGQPRANARITLQNPFGSSSGALRVDNFVHVTTSVDGRFAVDKMVQPGLFMLAVDDCEVVRPAPLTLGPEPATQDVTIVVKPAAEMVSITGTVVDDADQPITEAWIETDDGDGPKTVSRRDGRFELKERRDAARDDVRIAVRSFLHEPLRVDQPLAWGMQGVVLRLQRGASVTVRVTDANGAPVPSFAVRVLPLNSRVGSSNHGRVQARGPFVDGTATIASVPIGKWLVWIEPATGSAVTMVTAPIEIVDRSPRRLDLRVVDATRTVRLVDRAGTAIVGSKVRVVDPVEGPVEDGTQVVAPDVFAGMSAPRKAVLVSEGTTDPAGAVVVRGPADRTVTLLLDGPGHVPTVRSDVSLAETANFVVTVDLGGSVTGRITPPEAIVELRRLMGLPLEGPIPLDRAATWARVNLTGQRAQKPPLAFVLDAQGRFVGHGIPPGTWGTGISLGASWASGGSVVIREGETSDVVLDLSSLLPGALVGEVTWNGVPLANDAVHLDWVTPTGREHPDRGQCDVRTDAQGRFEHRGRPGTYTLTLQKPGRTVLRLRAGSTATVARDQTTHHAFAIASGKIELVLLDLEGRPAQVGQLMANGEDLATSAQLARDDATGPFRAEVAPGDYGLFVLPGSQSISRRMQAAPQGVPFDLNEFMRRVRVKVGHATVVPGQTTRLELRMTSEAPR
ncbi:MAG: sigma-70 family RNA polymerase sigma factor [Planctomycetota bacterium]|nr:sigma-70 family RNA polymerase sigma factor [Planctomycetota bacterium]